MDVTGSGGNSNTKSVSLSVLSAGTVVTKKRVPSESEAAEVAQAQVETSVDQSSEATEAVKALTRGLQGVADLFVTSEPSRKPPLQQEAKALAEKLSQELRATVSDEPIDEKLKVLAQTLASIFGDDEVKPPAMSTKDFILSVLTRVSQATVAAAADKVDDVAAENKRAALTSPEEIDELVGRITTTDRGSLLKSFTAPNVALLTS